MGALVPALLSDSPTVPTNTEVVMVGLKIYLGRFAPYLDRP